MTRRVRAPVLPLAALAATLGACEPDPQAPPAPEPLLPEDWAARYTEVRPCMPSGDHDLDNVRIVVDDAALGPIDVMAGERAVRWQDDPFGIEEGWA